jgi:hypothetical protein
MTKVRYIGFRTSWMEGDPQYADREVAAAVEETKVPLPQELMDLRGKIAQLAIFMSTSAFSKLKKEKKLEIIAEYTELNSIESGYAAAVKALAERSARD